MTPRVFSLTITLIWIALITLGGCVMSPRSKPATDPQQAADPLPSWNDGAVKQAIVRFVAHAADTASDGFIPVEDRIATFDNDGTLWAEKPIVQELFLYSQAKHMLDKNPDLARKQPFKSIVAGDKAYFEKGGLEAIMGLFVATQTGMTEDEYARQVADFISTTTYPGRNVPLKNIRYQPQLELLDFLRAHDFKVYICTGGTIGFVRSISRDFYGVPEEQVIGTTFKYSFADSSRKIMREPSLTHFNDQGGKPPAIQLHIGRPPVFACGNEGGHGDIAMLKFSQTSPYPSFQLLVNHDDAAREYAYEENDSLSLTTARKNKWHVISIRNDWNKVFAD